MSDAINEYEIGGLCVRMTAEQAQRWNSGNWTDEDDQTALVALPDEYAQGSSVRDGEVVLHSPQLTRTSEEITMAEAENRGLHEKYMEGMPANLQREDV